MIELVATPELDKVLRVDGRLMASSIHPSREAELWVESHREFLDKVNVIFLLGAGSPHHIQKLMKATEAKIVVLSLDSEVIEKVQSLVAFDTRRIQFKVIATPAQLRSDETVRSCVQQSFTVLEHAPSTFKNKKDYADLRAQLVGRDWGTLNWQWQLKGHAPLESQPSLGKRSEPLSILDLEQTELVQDSQERERMLIKALRELVK